MSNFVEIQVGLKKDGKNGETPNVLESSETPLGTFDSMTNSIARSVVLTYDSMSDLDLFKEAVTVNRENLDALRKLALLEFQNKNFLFAALSYEKIRDFK